MSPHRKMGLLDATRCAGRILSSFYERSALVLSILVAYLRHQEGGLHHKVVQIYLSPKKGQCFEIDFLLPECLDLLNPVHSQGKGLTELPFSSESSIRKLHARPSRSTYLMFSLLLFFPSLPGHVFYFPVFFV